MMRFPLNVHQHLLWLSCITVVIQSFTARLAPPPQQSEPQDLSYQAAMDGMRTLTYREDITTCTRLTSF